MKSFKGKYNNINFSEFDGKRILITGATGFVGNRLTEILSVETNAMITCIVNNYGNAYKLSRYNVNIVKGSILSAETVNDVCKNVDIVIHCAYGNRGSEEERNAVNIKGTENLCKAAFENGCERFIFLSTVMTYAFPETNILDENGKKTASKEPYGASKLAAEKIVHEYMAKGLPSVILQPTAIYGPWAPSYVMRVFKQIKSYKIPLIDGGMGICNAVYIDDLIQAILLVALNRKAINNTYLVNGNDYITWREYYRFFSGIIGGEIAVVLNEEEAQELIKAKRPFLPKVILKAMRVDVPYLKNNIPGDSAILKMYRSLPLTFRQRVAAKKKPMVVNKQSEEVKPVLSIDKDYIDFHKQTFKVSPQKLRSDVNYTPAYSFEAGFKEIERFYRWFYSDSISK